MIQVTISQNKTKFKVNVQKLKDKLNFSRNKIFSIIKNKTQKHNVSAFLVFSDS